MPHRDENPNAGEISDIQSNSIDGSGFVDLEGGAVSENEVIRSMRRPAMGNKQVIDPAHSYIDKRYYCVYASGIGKHVTARRIGQERRMYEKEYKKDGEAIRETHRVVQQRIPFR